MYAETGIKISSEKFLLLLLMMTMVISCDSNVAVSPEEPNEVEEIYQIPIVVHVIHFGEPIGEGHNLSVEQIESQIRVLNEDFRRKEGTRGFNNHPDGGDARIEFELAEVDPDGKQTNGIVRVNAAETEGPLEFHRFDYYGSLSYWNPDYYINIWTEPMPGELTDLVLGKAIGPETDLPGADLFEPGEPIQPEGILINSAHFGETDIDSDYNLGRTLVHEMGHYLGLLHTWGTRDCSTNDYCEDTPPVTGPNAGTACDGGPVMKENYMTFSHDRVMNVFTNDQIKRMHHVLENSPRRVSLLTSPALIKNK